MFCFRASGHVDRFADLMTKDAKTGECFRLDHLIKAHLEKLASTKQATPDVKTECQDIITKVRNNSLKHKIENTVIYV